jgi:hypothetical protein
MHAESARNLPSSPCGQPANQAHFPRLLTLAYSPAAPQESTINDIEEAISRVRRAAIERAVRLYVQLHDDGLRVKVSAAVMAELKTMRFGSGRDLRDWFSTFGAVLARMQRSCGPCHPAGRLARCAHADDLLAEARLRLTLTQHRTLLRTLDSSLGSQTRRQQLTSRQLRDAEQLRRATRGQEEEASRSLSSVVRRATYRDAFEIAWKASADPVYTFRLDKE